MTGVVAGVIIGVVAVGVVGYFLLRALRIVQQATSGGERFGEFRSIRQPGMSILLPSPTAWKRSTCASSDDR